MFDPPEPGSALRRLTHDEICIIEIDGKEYEATWSANIYRFFVSGTSGDSVHHSEVDQWRPASTKF